MINPDYLRTFIALMETAHFTKTAERLNMTQPGVSQHIKKLEEHFSTSLIQRKGKSFVATDSGLRLLEYSRRLFSEYELLKAKLRLDDPFSGDCKLSSPGSLGLKLFDVLLALAKDYPGLMPRLTVAPNHSIPLLLLNREIDLGYMTKKPEDHRLEYQKISEEQLLLIVPRGTRVRSFEDLVQLGFVDHPDGYHLAGRLLHRNFQDDFVSMESIPTRVFINQINRILDPVAAGLGFTVLPQGVLHKYEGAKKLSVVRLKVRVVDEIFKVWRRHEVRPRRYQTIEDSLQQQL